MAVQSPCIGVCRLDARSGLCAGCLRTTEEIGAWSSMAEEDRRQVIVLVERRRAETTSLQ